MIGQTNLKKTMELTKLPNFTIFVGEQGSGKKTFVREYLKTENVWLNSVKVDDIRNMIELSYKLHDNVFVIPDADAMSLSAKNAILKVVEECPNNNKYIMTLESLENTLDTIKSRASVFNMDRYTHGEILEYTTSTYGNELQTEQLKIVGDLCRTPGEVNKLVSNGIIKFSNYVNLVIDNIAEVSGANAFKIADKIALRGEDDKYDLKLFWRAFQLKCMQRDVTERICNAVIVTQNCARDLKVTGINKPALFDKWILSVREVWM